DAAGELKYLNQIKKELAEQFVNPEEDFVKFFTAKVYDGVQTAKVKAQFSELMKKALKQFLSDSINARLKSAIGNDVKDPDTNIVEEPIDDNDDKPKVVTTDEEIEGFNVVKAILRQKVELQRVHPRDTQSYFGILLDDNNRKPLCRLWFNTKQKYIGIFDESKSETRYPIECIDDIFNYSEQLQKTLVLYD
ncbi:restriction endonuclease, partial [Vibrio sp. V39_P1S14PM300]|nr:restriction endonuclease [Vibrio sp. V39_P1S14PM300]